METVGEQVAREEGSEPAPELKWPLPFNISLEKLELVAKGYFQAKADQHPVSASDLSKTTGLSDATVKANSRFLSALRVLRPTDGHLYSLTDEGSDYVKALSSSNADEVARLVKKMIATSPLQDLANFIELRGSRTLSYDQLFAHIKTMARVPENPKYARGVSGPYVTGINTLIDLFIKGQILPPDVRSVKTEGKVNISVKRTGIGKQTAAQRDAESVSMESRSASLGAIPQMPVSLNIVVEAKDATSIKELIGLIRELRGQSQS